MSFRRSEGTVGVEYELQLVDAETLDLVDGASRVLDRFTDNGFVKPEYIRSTIEITTPVCTSVSEIDRALRSELVAVSRVCEAQGMRLCAAGTHPFCRRLSTITALPRYQRMAGEFGILAEAQATLALQIHVGMASAAEAVRALHELHACLPMLLALSASSPFWHGYDTGFVSWRHRLLAANRTSGIPPRFRTWSAIESFFAAGQRSGVIEGWRDVHWDLRPRPDYGTVEIRIMDAVPTVTEAVALAAFARALTLYLVRTPPSRRPGGWPRPLPHWLEKENLFRASHLGLDARYVADARGEVVRPLREIAAAAVDVVSPIAHELGDSAHLELMHARVMCAPSHRRQRDDYALSQSLRAVVRNLARELRSDLEGVNDRRESA